MARTPFFVRIVPAGLLGGLLATGLAAQTTVSVACNLDSTLYQDLSGSISNGAGRNVFVGETATGLARRALLRFDVAGAVPAGAKIVAATLRLNVNRCIDSADLLVDAHRLSTTWGEGASSPSGAGGGGGAGGPSQTGDATWIHRFYSTTLWTTPGGDFSVTPSFTFALPTTGALVVPASPGLVADVQAWLDTPATNFGWILKSQSETTSLTARRLDSRQSLTPVARPTLDVSYLLPGQVGTWGIGCPSGAGTFSFTFTGSMVGGQTAFLSHTNGPANALGINIFALELNQPGIDLVPGCTVYLPASGAWITGFGFVLDGAGATSLAWPLPTVYPGLYFMSQSVAFDAAAPLGFVLTNAGVGVIQ